jgi:hypothetical protein
MTACFIEPLLLQVRPWVRQAAAGYRSSTTTARRISTLHPRLYRAAARPRKPLGEAAEKIETQSKKSAIDRILAVRQHGGREELRDAQAHPDRYRGLCVRVTGCSAYFVQMGTKAKEELIRRTEQG